MMMPLFKKKKGGVAIQQVKNPTIICEDVG